MPLAIQTTLRNFICKNTSTLTNKTCTGKKLCIAPCWVVVWGQQSRLHGDIPDPVLQINLLLEQTGNNLKCNEAVPSTYMYGCNK
jgi:hypothetical protein